MKLTSILLNRQGKKSRDSRAFIYAVVLPLASVLFASTANAGAVASSSVASSALESQARIQYLVTLQERQRKLLEFLLQDWQLDDPPANSVFLFKERRPTLPSLAVVFACPELPEAVRLEQVLLANQLNGGSVVDFILPDPPRRGPPDA
ncbi:MAG: hypothetical protein ACFCU1_02535 [Sumerlaeia bacterium]